MKKILLASTILVGTAGFAAAENANFTFSGEAATGFAYSTNGIISFATPTISAEFTAGMMTTTDSGLEAGASITVSAAGRGMDTDNDSNTTFGLVTTSGSSISDAEVYLSGDWGTVTVSYDSNTASVPGDDTMTYAYNNTWGDFTFDADYTWMPGAGNDTASATGTYAIGDYSVYAGVNLDEVGGWGLESVDFGGSASMSGFSAAVDVNYHTSPAPTLLTWKATAGYATGPYSVEVFVQDDNGVGGVDYGASAAYDLGGGVALNAGYVHDNDFPFGGVDAVTAGVSMAF